MVCDCCPEQCHTAFWGYTPCVSLTARIVIYKTTFDLTMSMNCEVWWPYYLGAVSWLRGWWLCIVIRSEHSLIPIKQLVSHFQHCHYKTFNCNQSKLANVDELLSRLCLLSEQPLAGIITSSSTQHRSIALISCLTISCNYKYMLHRQPQIYDLIQENEEWKRDYL